MTHSNDHKKPPVDRRWASMKDWISSPFYIAGFFSVLVFFHLILVIGRKISYHLFYRGLYAMCVCLMWNLRIIVGARYVIIKNSDLPTDRPIILVSNHQSMYDIPYLIAIFEKYYLSFISKVELSRGLPSISFAVRNNGSALIDRKDKSQAIREIQRAARNAAKPMHGICIFPEGTRSRDGVLKPFKPGGFLTLCKEMPDAVIIPIAISRSWEHLRANLWPIPRDVIVTVEVLPALMIDSANSPIQVLDEAQRQIAERVIARQR